MRIELSEGRVLELIQGNITLEKADAIVNAANNRLAGGGGVDGAIHRQGGPLISAETRRLYPQGCPTGSAVATGAGNLAARYVIHAVGPIWQGGDKGEPELLAGAYEASLKLATSLGCKSVAFPAISTGVYGYPMEEASRVALSVVLDYLREHDEPEQVRFVLFSPDACAAFAATLKQLTAP